MTNSSNMSRNQKAFLIVDLCAAAIMAAFCILFAARSEVMLAVGFGIGALGALFTAKFRNRKKVG
ncbi:hypothetical protein ACFWA6_21705 [Streptomyces sp. NPDC060020]|uniref:hypothetical protein n=1 Tax=Streptomyces sp. NPDC060020 TaxID=3347038 RepID=UPI0036B60788